MAATLLGVLGVFLAAVGLYGVLASVVAARRREIGVRSALGAAPLRLALHVMRLGLVPSAIGAVFGITITLAAGRVLASQLYGIDVNDTLTYAGALAVVAAVALAACVIPAYRAARVSPAEVIRSE
jgi:ABC-type antimicrobial peptide transport system permease subunit